MLEVKCNLNENDDQKFSWYLNGLNEAIYNCLARQPIWSVDQAQNLVLKAERYLNVKRTPKVSMNPRFDLGNIFSSSKTESKASGVQPRKAESKKTDTKGD